MNKSEKKRRIKSPIVRGYLFFTGTVVSAAHLKGALFTAGIETEFVTLGYEDAGAKSFVSGYAQAQGIFTEPLENEGGNIIPEKAAQGLSYFLPPPAYGIYDLSFSVYNFGEDVMEAVYEARDKNKS